MKLPLVFRSFVCRSAIQLYNEIAIKKRELFDNELRQERAKQY